MDLRFWISGLDFRFGFHVWNSVVEFRFWISGVDFRLGFQGWISGRGDRWAGDGGTEGQQVPSIDLSGGTAGRQLGEPRANRDRTAY